MVDAKTKTMIHRQHHAKWPLWGAQRTGCPQRPPRPPVRFRPIDLTIRPTLLEDATTPHNAMIPWPPSRYSCNNNNVGVRRPQMHARRDTTR